MPSPPAIALQPKRLLVLDPIRPEHICVPLNQKNWQVHWHACAEEICESDIKENFNYVLIELRLPHRDGIAFIQRIIRCAPTVVWSAYGCLEIARCLQSQGAINFLPKPASWQQVVSTFGEEELEETLSLREARMLYIEEVFARAGSVSQAAKYLKVDRRSFRRMLESHAHEAAEGSAIARWAKNKQESDFPSSRPPKEGDTPPLRILPNPVPDLFPTLHLD